MAAEIVVTAQPKTAAHMALHGILAAIWGRCHHILPQLTQDTRWRSRYDEYFVRFAFDCIAATSMRMPLPNANGCEPSSRKLHRVSVSSQAALTGGALEGTQRTCWRSCGRATRSLADVPRSRTSCEASTTTRQCLRRRSCRSQSISCAHPSPRRLARHPHCPRWPHRAPRRYPWAGGARDVSCLQYAGGRTGVALGSHAALGRLENIELLEPLHRHGELKPELFVRRRSHRRSELGVDQRALRESAHVRGISARRRLPRAARMPPRRRAHGTLVRLLPRTTTRATLHGTRSSSMGLSCRGGIAGNGRVSVSPALAAPALASISALSTISKFLLGGRR